MPATPEPKPLHPHHRATLTKIFEHPLNHNIEWRSVLALLQELDAVTERHDGKFVVRLGSETETFERPDHKDIDAQMVIDLRRMLSNAGYRPDADGAA